MKVFISIDLEGISGVVHDAQTTHNTPEWEAARPLMRGDLDAALEGCRSAGAGEVVVCDSHDYFDNLTPDGLPENVTLISGAHLGLSMMNGVDESVDAVALVGYHARAGTMGGVLCHTYFDEVHRIHVVGPGGEYETGEFGLNAAVAGAFGVPVVFASGDDKLAAEASDLVPGVGCAVVKQGRTRRSAGLLAPDAAHALIAAGLRDALAASERPRPLDWSGRGLRVEFDQVEWAERAASCPGVTQLDGYTIEIPAGDWLQVFATFLAAGSLAAAG